MKDDFLKLFLLFLLIMEFVMYVTYYIVTEFNKPKQWYEQAPIEIVGCDFT